MPFPALYQSESPSQDLVYILGDRVYEAQTLQYRPDLSPRIVQNSRYYSQLLPELNGLTSHPILVISQNGYGLFSSQNGKLIPLHTDFLVQSDAIVNVISLIVPNFPYQVSKIQPADMSLPRFDENLFARSVRLNNSAATVNRLQALSI